MRIPSRLAFIAIVAALAPACGGGGGGGGAVVPPPPAFLPGQLDPNFGGKGVLQVNNQYGYVDHYSGVAADAAHFYTVGGFENSAPGDYYWRIEKRLLTDGSLVQALNPPMLAAGLQEIRGIAIDATSMYVAGRLSANGGQWHIQKRNLSDLASDGTYPNQTLDPSALNDEPFALALSATHLFVVGTDRTNNAAGGSAWRIEKRDLTTGAIAGSTTVDPSTSDDEPLGIALDATHAFVVGSDGGTGGGRWRVEKRSQSTGALDMGFGGGALSPDPSTFGDEATCVAVDATHLYVAGTKGGLLGSQWMIVKIEKAAGASDPGFGAAGIVTSTSGLGIARPTSIVIDGTTMIVGGYDAVGANRRWRYEKRNLSDGQLVASFGTAGVLLSDPTPGSDAIRGMTLAGTSILAVGYDDVLGETSARIEKRAASDGALDPVFGTPGAAVFTTGGLSDEPPRVLIRDATSLFAAGSNVVSGGPFDAQWSVAKRVLSDGSPAAGFGTEGVVTSNPTPTGVFNSEAVYGAAADATSIYLVGISKTTYAWRIEKRDLATGALVPAFDGDGVVEVDTGAGVDRAWTVAIEGTSLIIAGNDSAIAGGQVRIEKRNLSDGALVAGFGTGGVVSGELAPGNEPVQLAVEAPHFFVAGAGSLQKRNLSDGALVASFGTGGKVVAGGNAMAVDASGIYFLAQETPVANNTRWALTKRDKSTGALVASFGTAGKVVSDPTTGEDFPRALLADGGSLYLGGSEFVIGTDAQWRLEKRNADTGALDAAFGTAGVVTTNTSSGDPNITSEAIYGFAIDAEALYILGYDLKHDYQVNQPQGKWRIEKRGR
jgi:hypothetical protein